MDVERTDNFLPIRNFNDGVHRIFMMKTAMKTHADEHERILLSVQNRLKAGQRQIDLCTQESNSLEILINAVETKITASFLSNQSSETEVLNTVKENRNLKRKIIALKHDMEQQEKLLQRANETMDAVRNNCVKSKKLKELPTVST